MQQIFNAGCNVQEYYKMQRNFPFPKPPDKCPNCGKYQIENILYETQPHLKGMRVEIRYEPEWLLGSDKPVLIYVDGKKAGDARRVDFISNVYVKDCNDEELNH